MRSEEDGAAVRAGLGDDLVEGFEPVGIEGGRRLIQKKHRRIREQGHREAETLKHPAGVCGHRADHRAVQRGDAKGRGGVRGVDAADLAMEVQDLLAGQRILERDPLRKE